jgi:hypothetical protein
MFPTFKFVSPSMSGTRHAFLYLGSNKHAHVCKLQSSKTFTRRLKFHLHLRDLLLFSAGGSLAAGWATHVVQSGINYSSTLGVGREPAILLSQKLNCLETPKMRNPKLQNGPKRLRRCFSRRLLVHYKVGGKSSETSVAAHRHGVFNPYVQYTHLFLLNTRLVYQPQQFHSKTELKILAFSVIFY